MTKGVHRFALLVACATFFLIIAGANVTSHDAGLATSDWPRSNGTFFPKMVGNLFWEHGHRMIATAVGLLTIVLAVLLQIRERRPWVKRLGWIALGGVIAQGLLGGLTVKMNLPLAVSAAHATLAQLFFLITVSLAVFTSRNWVTPDSTVTENGEGLSLRVLCVVALIVILVQLVLGATLRHSATWDQDLPTGLLLAHVGGAIVVTLIVGATAAIVLLRYRTENYLAQPALIAASLLLIQLLLGVAAYITRAASPYDPQPMTPMVAVTVAHVACGALVFATMIVLTLRVSRVLRVDRREYVLAPA
ncbi:MAG: heme a synthase [Blastocatellia bacterium]|jgi:cytochrome c oxidase assembly protein subunit 15|nr:heme a synthase [Blastocatellia bacterium]